LKGESIGVQKRAVNTLTLLVRHPVRRVSVTCCRSGQPSCYVGGTRLSLICLTDDPVLGNVGNSVQKKVTSFTVRRPRIFVTVNCNWAHCVSGLGSVVGIATSYGLDSPGIKFQWGQDFPHLSRPVLDPTQPPVQWVPGLSQG
jgi:hypothetical protein